MEPVVPRKVGSPIAAIARASLVEHSRRRLIVFFVGISLLMTAVIVYFKLRSDQGGTVVAATGALGTLASLGFLGLLGTVAALAVSMGNIGRPFSDGEAVLVLARPVARWQYALGRLTASWAVVAGLCLLMAIEMQTIRLVGGEGVSGVLWAEWAVRGFNLSLMAALATLISTRVASPVLVAVSTFFVAGAFTWIGRLYQITEMTDAKGALAGAVRAAWFITPKQLNSPVLISQVLQLPEQARSQLPLMQNSPGLVLWAFAYLAAIVFMTMWAVNRIDIS